MAIVQPLKKKKKGPQGLNLVNLDEKKKNMWAIR